MLYSNATAYFIILATAVTLNASWFRGDALNFFGLFTIPAPFSPDRATAGFVKELHGLCANLILILSGPHASTALWHHFIRKMTFSSECSRDQP